jgi:hypothetical protein
MNNNYRFDYKKLATDTADAYSADSFNSWERVCRILAARGFNAWEAEAILRSKWTRWCRDEFQVGSTANSACLEKFLDKYHYKPGHSEVNELVLGTFDDLVANNRGVPCRKEKNLMSRRDILVPVGTPIGCDPSSETYWSM